jgi:hypothetical protein
MQDHLGRFVSAILERDGVQKSSFYKMVFSWLAELIEQESQRLLVRPDKVRWLASQVEDEEVSCGATVAFKKDDKNLNDQKYAYNQMLLAKTLADSFMECWKVKYIYQTKRPNMTDKTIDLAMPNPKFASYTSGHSTISFSAAGVLTSLFPEQKEIWVKNATDAKNSRLWAGIHFPYDNNEGQKLGEEVAKNILENL